MSAIRPGRLGRIAALVLLPAWFLLAGAPLVAPADVLGATPDLTLVTNARYVVQPEHARVRVVVDIDAANHTSETVTRRFYFEDGYLAVLPGTSSFTVTADGAHPTVTVKSRKSDYTLLWIHFGKRIYSGDNLRLRLAFDLKDPGGSPTRDVRIGSTLVTFPVWAFATTSTSGSTVSVTFPAGYVPQLQAGAFPAPTTSAKGETTYRTPPLSNPLTFSAYFVAERPAAYVQSTRVATVGAQHMELTLRAWPEDADWAKRTGEVFARGLGALSAAIGLPIDAARLTVEEAASRTIGGYAGLYDPGRATVRVAYSAGPFVALHEAAHTWFNGSFLVDRWANEAFASYYANYVAGAAGVTPAVEPLTPALEQKRIPLNAWGAVGQSDPGIDDYAYAASAQLAEEIARSAGGPAELRSVWAAIAGHEAAYQPAGSPGIVERASGPPDWRSLLDMLEERTGRPFDALWRTWVVRPEEATLLDSRAMTRAEYRAALAEAGSWELPGSIRAALDAWRFDDARVLIATARTVLGARSSIAEEAAAADLQLPDRLRQAFEGVSGPSAAVAELDIERQTIGDVARAEVAAAAPRDTLASIGLYGQQPDTWLADAKSAFAAGDLDRASADATTASAIFNDAERSGRGRAVSALAAIASLSFLVAAAARQVRRRRRPHAHRAGAGRTGPAEPYATLAVDPTGERSSAAGALGGTHQGAKPAPSSPGSTDPVQAIDGSSSRDVSADPARVRKTGDEPS